MKKIFIGIFLFIGLFIHGQDESADQTKKSITESDFNDVIFQVNLPKDKIYDKCILWIAENFKSAKAVLEIQDKQNGKIIGNGSFTIPYVMNVATIKFTMIIDIKDNKYRVQIINRMIDYGKMEVSLDPKTDFPMTIQLSYKKFVELNTRLFAYLNTKEKDW